VDHEHVRAGVQELLGDEAVEPLDERHHRDHRGDADDDAEQRQERAELVRADAPQRDAHALAQVQSAPFASAGGSLAGRGFGFTWSLSILPSRMRTTRRACSAMSGSCVTRMTVLPAFQIASNAAMISSPVRESRFPVGSSARMMLGLFTSARAIATRWRWPPESSFGRCFMRSPRPTSSSDSRARRRRSSCFMPAYTSGSSTLCSASARASRLNVWKTNPISWLRMRASSSSVRSAISLPLSWYEPWLGVSRQSRMFMSVDLPEPDGPMIATYSFCSMSRSTPFSARTSLSPTWYLRCR